MNPADRIPPGIHNAIDYELLAPQAMDASHHAYVAGGCGWDTTVAANRAAYGHWAPLPRLLRDVRQGHTQLTLGGLALPHPFLLAPVAYQRLAHAGAETATARAAQATGTCMVARVASSTPSSKPRQPAWAAATTLLASSQKSTGRQSAVMTAQGTPGWREKAASACGGGASGESSAASTTVVPCTCSSQRGELPISAPSCARLAATACGSSPTCSPRLKPA